MWLYGGWNEASEKSLGDMHILRFEQGSMRWEAISPGGFDMEARAWHSVCVYKDQMLLYGDNGECSQSIGNMRMVFVFDFATRSWLTKACTGTS